MPVRIFRTGRVWSAGAALTLFLAGLSAGWAGPTLPAGLFDSATAYDPVARALALGLTAEQFDARTDRALAEAERCSRTPLGETLACQDRPLPATPVPTS